MDNEMIERLCRAAHDTAVKTGAHIPKSYDDIRITPEMKESLKTTVLGIVKAMREPTEKMSVAGDERIIHHLNSHEIKLADPTPSQNCFTAMIDAVIND